VNKSYEHALFNSQFGCLSVYKNLRTAEHIVMKYDNWELY